MRKRCSDNLRSDFDVVVFIRILTAIAISELTKSIYPEIVKEKK